MLVARFAKGSWGVAPTSLSFMSVPYYCLSAISTEVSILNCLCDCDCQRNCVVSVCK